jgi:glutathione S-transferase
MSNRLGCIPQEMTNLRAYVQRISERPAFAKAIVMGL